VSLRFVAAGGSTVGGAMNALCALLNPSLPDESMRAVSSDIDDGADDRTAVTALAGSGDEA
jgi:hypothetical protein